MHVDFRVLPCCNARNGALAILWSAALLSAIPSLRKQPDPAPPPQMLVAAEAKPTPPPYGKLSHAALAVALQRAAAIDREAARFPNHDWAGTYICQNRMLKLAPAAGFVYLSRGRSGWIDQNYGTVGQLPATLVLNSVFTSKTEGQPSLPTTLIPVHWGGRHYLLAGSQVKQIPNAATLGWEPSAPAPGQYFLREGDQQKPAMGLPEVPREFHP